MTPLISFVVTYYNEPYALLRACIESILTLNLSPDEAEILVVQDGVEHKIQDKVCSLSPLVGYVCQEHAGLSVARNTGISCSHGRYIQFVDADDCLEPLAYAAVLEHLRSQEDDTVMFRMTTKQGEKSRRLSARQTTGKDFLLRHNLRAAAWGYAFRRDILGNLRFSPGLLHEDELFTPQLLLRVKSLRLLDAKAYFYRQREGTITHAKSLEMVKKRLDDIFSIIITLRSLEQPLLDRRIRQLTVDYIQNTWMLTRSHSELRQRCSQLRSEGLLPLPIRMYSLRYFLASVVTSLL